MKKNVRKLLFVLCVVVAAGRAYIYSNILFAKR